MNILSWIMAPSTRTTRKWEIFPGRNKFYCNGFLMTTPHNGVFFLTLILLTATSGLFFAFDCPFLATRISAAIPTIGAGLFLFTLGSLLRTSFSDPGIIPRASYDEARYIEKQIEVPNSYNSPTYRPPPRTKEVLVRGQAVKLKYCYTCKIFRPPRASHCSLCDNCVDRFDHHCPWVGNCVGKRNYRFFYMFVMSLAFLIVYVFSCSMTHVILLAKENDEFIEVVKKTPFSIITATICFISVWSVIGLAGFHTYLTACEQTTNEDIKGAFSAKEGQQTTNPYSRGNLLLNCFHVLCGPITPSLIDRRGVVTDAYRIQMRRPQPVQYNVPAVPALTPQIHDLEGQVISGGGVYRQRSYDNLQNGKLPCRNMNLLRLTQSYDQIQQLPIIHQQNINNIKNNQPIPSNFEYFTPQKKNNNNDNIDNDNDNDKEQLQLQQQDNINNINNIINNKTKKELIKLSRYPFHKNRAISRKNPNELFYNNFISSENDLYDINNYKDDFISEQMLTSIIKEQQHQQQQQNQQQLDNYNNTELDPMLKSHHNDYLLTKMKNVQHFHSSPSKKKQRYSSVYEYSYHHDLNSIYEDSASDT